MKYDMPAQWDYLWSSNTPAKLLSSLRKLSVLPDTQAAVIYDARVTQCLLGTRQDDAALDYANAALKRYQGRPGLDVALLRAIRLLALMSMSATEETIRSAPLIQGTDATRMEAAVFSHYAVSTAHSLQGDPDAAMLFLARAEAIAHLLGMTHRLRVMRIELARLRLQADHIVEPEPVIDDADTAHRATSRFGNTVATVALAARGEFRRAIDRAAPIMLEELPLLYALAGRADPHEVSSDTWYDLAAQSIRAAEAGHYNDMPILQVDSKPLSKYGPVLNGLRAVQLDAPSTAIEVALGPRPKRPDIRYLWNMVRMTAILNGRINGDLLLTADEIFQDLRRVPGACELVGLTERLLPHQTLLLTYMPGAADVPALSGVNVAVLMGNAVRGPVRMDIHGETADVLIGRPLKIDVVINTGFLSKARTKLRAAGVDMDQMVTAGHLYLWLRQFALAATGTGVATEWQAQLIGLVKAAPRLRTLLRGIRETDPAAHLIMEA